MGPGLPPASMHSGACNTPMKVAASQRSLPLMLPPAPPACPLAEQPSEQDHHDRRGRQPHAAQHLGGRLPAGAVQGNAVWCRGMRCGMTGCCLARAQQPADGLAVPTYPSQPSTWLFPCPLVCRKPCLGSASQSTRTVRFLLCMGAGRAVACLQGMHTRMARGLAAAFDITCSK